MPRKTASSGLNQYGFKVRKVTSAPSDAKPSGFPSSATPAKMVQPKAKVAKTRTTLKAQGPSKARKRSADSDSNLLKPKDASKITKSKQFSKSTKITKPTADSGLGKSTNKRNTTKVSTKVAATSSGGPPNASSKSKGANLLPSPPGSGVTANTSIAAVSGNFTPDTLIPRTGTADATSQDQVVKLVDATSRVKPDALVEPRTVPITAGIQSTKETEVELSKLPNSGHLAGRLVSGVPAVSTVTNDTSAAHNTTLPTRHHSPAIDHSLSFKTPTLYMPSSVRQVRDPPVISAISGIRIPASQPSITETISISFTPVNARLITSRNGFDEYTISASCQTPSGSASRTDVLRAFQQHIKSGVPAIGASRFPGDVTQATDDSSEDEPLMNHVIERRAATKNQALDDQRARTSIHPQVTRKDVQAIRMVPHSQEQTRLDVPSRPSTSRSSKRTLSALDPPARRQTPPRRGPSDRPLLTSRVVRASTRSKTPARLSRKTPVPPTVRRRRMWEKTEALLPSYIARLNKPTRRRIFTRPTTVGVRLDRLETFWGVLGDVITENEAFAGVKGWEDAIDILQRVNSRMGGGVMFGEEEGKSVMQELSQQRMLIVAGGKVMLTRNALSTRLS